MTYFKYDQIGQTPAISVVKISQAWNRAVAALIARRFQGTAATFGQDGALIKLALRAAGGNLDFAEEIFSAAALRVRKAKPFDPAIGIPPDYLALIVKSARAAVLKDRGRNVTAQALERGGGSKDFDDDGEPKWAPIDVTPDTDDMWHPGDPLVWKSGPRRGQPRYVRAKDMARWGDDELAAEAQAEQLDVARRKIARAPLSPRDRQIVTLVDRGLTKDEIAARLGIAISNLDSRLSRRILPRIRDTKPGNMAASPDQRRRRVIFSQRIPDADLRPIDLYRSKDWWKDGIGIRQERPFWAIPERYRTPEQQIDFRTGWRYVSRLRPAMPEGLMRMQPLSEQFGATPDFVKRSMVSGGIGIEYKDGRATRDNNQEVPDEWLRGHTEGNRWLKLSPEHGWPKAGKQIAPPPKLQRGAQRLAPGTYWTTGERRNIGTVVGQTPHPLPEVKFDCAVRKQWKGRAPPIPDGFPVTICEPAVAKDVEWMAPHPGLNNLPTVHRTGQYGLSHRLAMLLIAEWRLVTRDRNAFQSSHWVARGHYRGEPLPSAPAWQNKTYPVQRLRPRWVYRNHGDAYRRVA